ncbi:NADP-dependent 3-hydroxy acid dehydrogenase YdfG [Trichococcus patagoniensis]|uniref:NADP-dependent 3-hydroxy acid dehydrogenase YdfG n=1 Tax=Trichococcus patagoniensis TaxID=382641 RepID=A0A2T5IKF5_9LACT|nr:NADP-dependent 3-hydroxy acid dehydrogenase YdfG [Trichococcus patagoniensis]
MSSGFGYELTKPLLDKVDTVLGTVHNKAKISDLITEYPTLFDCQILDVTDTPTVHQVVKESFVKHGEIDVIINNAGYGGQVAFPGNSMYHATKFGIEGFCESVAQEVESFNIGVTLVEPGGARTEFRYGSAQVADLMPE